MTINPAEEPSASCESNAPKTRFWFWCWNDPGLGNVQYPGIKKWQRLQVSKSRGFRTSDDTTIGPKTHFITVVIKCGMANHLSTFFCTSRTAGPDVVVRFGKHVSVFRPSQAIQQHHVQLILINPLQPQTLPNFYFSFVHF